MAEMLSLYAWTLAAGTLAAPALALLGAQLAARDRALQTLCVGQGALVGVLAGLGTLHWFNLTELEGVAPFFSALAFSSLTLLVTDRLVTDRSASKNTFFAFIFSVLIAAGHLATSLFPDLESHMAQVYFGDLATLTNADAKSTLVVAGLALLVLSVFYRSISDASFQAAIFGAPLSPRLGARLFPFLSLAILCLSVQFVGFLYTVAMLFLPTALMSFSAIKGLKRHFVLCAALAALSSLLGFLLSLHFTRLPTVPAIVLVLMTVSLAYLGLERVVLSVSPRARPL